MHAAGAAGAGAAAAKAGASSPLLRCRRGRLVYEAKHMKHLGCLGLALRHLLALEKELRRELRNVTRDALETLVMQGFNCTKGF